MEGWVTWSLLAPTLECSDSWHWVIQGPWNVPEETKARWAERQRAVNIGLRVPQWGWLEIARRWWLPRSKDTNRKHNFQAPWLGGNLSLASTLCCWEGSASKESQAKVTHASWEPLISASTDICVLAQEVTLLRPLPPDQINGTFTALLGGSQNSPLV